MGRDNPEIPFTELVERVQKLSRAADNTLEKIRGVIQDVYCREIPAKFDWNFLITSSSLTTIEQYATGTVSVNTGATSLTFSSDAAITASMIGRKIKFSGADAIYELSTTADLNTAYQGPSNLSGVSYTIFQPIYALAGDFDRFPKIGGIYKWTGGKKDVLEETQYSNYIDKDFEATPSIPKKVRLVGHDTAGNQLVELIPPPKDSRIYGYDYLRQLSPLLQTSAGTIKGISANSTVFSGNDNTRFLEAKSDGTYFLRVNELGVGQDSTWRRVLALSSNSDGTFAIAFANSAITSSATYVISREPELPIRLHIGVLYGAMEKVIVDQNDPNFAYYHVQYAMVLSDAKKIFVSRPYSQEITGVFEDYQYRR